MSGRKLRSGTRRDYSKMVKGENGALADQNNLSSDNEVYACVNDQNNNNGGLFTNSDLELEPEESCSESCSSESDSEEILLAEERLKKAKKEKKRLLKKEKLDRLARETTEIEASLKSLRGKNKKHGGAAEKPTMASLRGMGDVE